MSTSRLYRFDRRGFLAGVSAVGAASLLGLHRPASAEPPPETSRIRLSDGPFLCFAPLYLAEDLLRLEGFRNVEYIRDETGIDSDYGDLAIYGGPGILPVIDTGGPWVVLSGLHVGCWELMGNDRIRSVGDLKGKAVAAGAIRSVEYLWITSILAYIGMDARTDVEWVETGSIAESQRLFLQGNVDAFLAFPPQPQEVRLSKFGHTLVHTTFDRPWSQYFCCMVTMRRDFVRRFPIATKRALRAMLKAADVCAAEPERAARYLAEKGFEPRYDMALGVLRDLPYDRWRTDNPEDTLRFHALRLHEVGLIKSTPQQIIARGTDWRFLNELRRELKA
jgi:NitT/TauT family transport system substrate-binding protein